MPDRWAAGLATDRRRLWAAWSLALLLCLALVVPVPNALGAQSGGVQTLTNALAIDPVDVANIGPVTLPYDWDRHHRGVGGWMRFELSFSLPSLQDEPYGFYLPRIGNRARIYLNGELVALFGDVHQVKTEDFARTPRFVPISSSLLRHDNTLVIDISADPGRRGGLSVIVAGPADAVRGGPFFWSYTWRVVVGSVLMGGFSLLTFLVTLGLWLTQRETGHGGIERRDRFYGYAAISQLCWFLYNANVALQHPPLGWPAWGVLMALAYGGWLAGSFLLCQHAADWRVGPSSRTSRWLAIGGPLAGAGLAWLSSTVGVLWPAYVWQVAVMVLLLFYIVRYTRFALLRRDSVCLLLTVACWVNLVAGVRDWTQVYWPRDGGEIHWLSYSSLLFGMVLAYVALVRFSRASRQARELTLALTQRVAQREAELRDMYQRLELMARSEAKATERARILSDLHDGVGSHLSLAIHQMQGASAPKAEVLQTLRDTQAYLKLSIDAMHLEAGDVAGLLANLRYRLQDRLSAGGMRLVWQVEDLDLLPSMDDAALVQLQYILFEALSNILQHGGATEICVAAAQRDGAVHLSVTDNGRGFDVDTANGKGLRTMRERADRIGARLQIDSSPGHTLVALVLQP